MKQKNTQISLPKNEFWNVPFGEWEDKMNFSRKYYKLII